MFAVASRAIKLTSTSDAQVIPVINPNDYFKATFVFIRNDVATLTIPRLRSTDFTASTSLLLVGSVMVLMKGEIVVLQISLGFSFWSKCDRSVVKFEDFFLTVMCYDVL